MTETIAGLVWAAYHKNLPDLHDKIQDAWGRRARAHWENYAPFDKASRFITEYAKSLDNAARVSKGRDYQSWDVSADSTDVHIELHIAKPMEPACTIRANWTERDGQLTFQPIGIETLDVLLAETARIRSAAPRSYAVNAWLKQHYKSLKPTPGWGNLWLLEGTLPLGHKNSDMPLNVSICLEDRPGKKTLFEIKLKRV
ncbi:hypothetical protein HY642_01030 [Candidatus Woesearchaeota archaeon]|nr:hypothetical protein [Candidatus Woesearchaeota archaeon]